MTNPTRHMSGPIVALLGVLFIAPLSAQSPALAADDTWISVNGTVTSVSPDVFTLKYDTGTIRVEMDDGDRDADAYKLLVGDTVTVNGIIDDDFLEEKKIEASSVHVKNIGTTFYSSAVDEEDPWVLAPLAIVPTVTTVEGTVKRVGDDQFMLAVGGMMLEVEVDEMSYDPLDDEGYQKVRAGDRVRVTGDSDYELFDGRVFNASSVVTLRKAHRM